MKQVEEEKQFDRHDMEPVKRKSTCWDVRSEFVAVNVGDYKPFRPPPLGARGPGYWTTDGDWVKDVKVEGEQSNAAPRPPPPTATGPGRWNSDGEWIE
eukprot:884795-Amphidinium_carterae.1